MREIMTVTASFMPVLESAHALVARLDVFCSLAHVSYSAPYPYIKPKLFPLGEGGALTSENRSFSHSVGDLELVNVRHPVLEIQPDMNYIPNSISMKRGESTFHVCSLMAMVHFS
jgi:DNA mismatch repair protein MSH2